MKKLTLLSMTLLVFSQAGCEFIGGALVGAGATSAGYEYNAYRQMQQLEEDYKNERFLVKNTKSGSNRQKQDQSSTNSSQSCVADMVVIS